MSDQESSGTEEAIAPRARFRLSGSQRNAASISGIVILVLALWWLWNWWSFGRFQVDTNNAYLHADTVVVAPKVAGYVEKVLVRANQQVKQGQILVLIDQGPFAAALESANAEVAAREADLARTQAEMGRQGAQIAQSGAQADVERRGAELADTEARRYAELAAIGADTRQRADETAANRDQARARTRAALAGTETARRTLDTLAAQLKQNRAALAAAHARERQARLDFEAATVRAGQAGLIGDKTVATGQYVQAGTRLMSIVPANDIYIEANLKETQMKAIRVGQPVRIHIDAFPDDEIKGEVESRSPGTGAQFALLPPNNATGNFTKIVQRVPVRIRIHPSADLRPLLIPGLSAEVSIDTRSNR